MALRGLHNIYKIKIGYSFVWTLSFLTGVFVTMPIITVPIGGRLLSVFSILFFLYFFCVLFFCIKSKATLSISSPVFLLALWFLVAITSSVFGLIYFGGMPAWTAKISSYFFKIILYFFLLIFLYRVRHKKILVSSFLKGFIVGCAVNLVWVFLEGVIFYSYGISINNFLFSNYLVNLPENRQFISIVRNGSIRATGFNYDPAHLGGIIPVVFIYSVLERKLLLLVLAFIAAMFSQSTTAVVCCLFVLIVSIGKTNILSTFKNRLIFLKSIIFLFIFLFIFVVGNFPPKSILDNSSAFYQRVSNVYLSGDIPSIRVAYATHLPAAILFNGMKSLTGTGFGTASHPYVFDDYMQSSFGLNVGPYDPENTYISYLFDTGILGLCLYLLILFKYFIYYRRRLQSSENIIIYSALCGLIFSGLFYHYTLTAHQVLLIVFASIFIKKGNGLEVQE